MTAGIPGTGISAIFYALLAVSMLFGELRRVAQGRSSWRRWRHILALNGMVALAAVLIWVQGLLLALFLRPRPSGANIWGWNLMTLLPLEIALYTLVAVIASFQFLRLARGLWLRRGFRGRQPGPRGISREGGAS